MHGFPPKEGAGLSHERFLCLSPSPQLELHDDHVLQSLQLPWTAKRSVMLLHTKGTIHLFCDALMINFYVDAILKYITSILPSKIH